MLESMHIRCSFFREPPWGIERNEMLYYDNKGGEPLLPFSSHDALLKLLLFWILFIKNSNGTSNAFPLILDAQAVGSNTVVRTVSPFPLSIPQQHRDSRPWKCQSSPVLLYLHKLNKPS